MDTYALRIWGILPFTLFILNTVSAQSVTATGPEAGTRLEDRVEVSWPDSTLPVNESYSIYRQGSLIAYAAATEHVYDDLTAEPDSTYEYCVSVRHANNTETQIGCDDGGRVINRPTGFTASDGFYEDRVQLDWSDRSQIEAGFNIYRDAGYALDLDGSNDYVFVPGITVIPASFTVEFWTSRASNGTSDYIFNLESTPEGNPTNVDLEIGFNSLNQFTFAFGGSILTTPSAYTDSDWHHWAATYDAASRRRTIYRDGVQVATDIYTQDYAPSGNLEFGRRAGTGNADNKGYYGGQVDELRLWNRALGVVDVQSLMDHLLTNSETGLVDHWPMDMMAGTNVPDIVGTRSGTISNPGVDPDWSPSGVPGYHKQIGADLTSYSDMATVPGFQSYTYGIAAFEDIDGDGIYTPGVDFESARPPATTDTGWRAALAPPGQVSATDGQFLDRVRVTWEDRSQSETAFNIYRDGGLIASVPADSTRYDDFGATATHEYCVAASDGVESVQVCDVGRVGGLAPPADVAATDSTYDDRVRVTWSDTTDTEDGFEVFRDGDSIGTTEADAQEFNDFGALQDVPYTYCVRAFSNADPANPSYSTQVCAPEQGFRIAVLPPEQVSATDSTYEDRIDLTWSNPSKTAMLFRLYKDDVLIDVLDPATTMYTDMGGNPPFESDTQYEYCVSAETVVPESGAVSGGPGELQAKVSQELNRIQMEDAIRLRTGGTPTTPEAVLADVYQSLGLNVLGKTAAGGVESDTTCDLGSRHLAAPTSVDATDDKYESHVEVTWDDNSTTNTGYRVYRGGVLIGDLMGGDRTTYEDYTGTPGIQYNYSVRAFDDFGVSDQDSNVGKRTLNPPTGLKASDGTSEMVVELEWKDNSGAEKGYHIYRREVGFGSDSLIASTGANQEAYVDSLANSGGTLGFPYRYTVTAFDDYGESFAVSDIGRTRLNAPANINASDVYPDRIVIIWVDRSEVEGGYRLARRQVGSAPGVFTWTTDLAANTTMYTDTPPSQGIKYQYCVEAVLSSALSTPLCDVGIEPSPPTPPGPGNVAVQINPITFTSRTDGAVQFGTDVAADDPDLLVGAPGADPESGLFGGLTGSTGIVNLYSSLPTVDDTWGTSKDTGDPQRQDFGYSVDIDGDYAVVGDPFLSDNTHGAFSIFKRESGTWSQVLLTEEDDSFGDNTGIAVAEVDSFAIVGNSVRQESSHTFGSAIICNVEAALRLSETCARADEDRQLETLVPSSSVKDNADFGRAVDITRVDDSLYAIVGAPGIDKAFLFKCDFSTVACDTVSDWVELTEFDTKFRPNRQFGAAVAINSKVAIVGAPGAEGFVLYQRDGADWKEAAIFNQSSPDDVTEYGAAVAVSDTTIVVGAPGEAIADLDNAGAVYVMEWDSVNSAFSEPVRYDTRVAGYLPVSKRIFKNARFGSSVDVGPTYYYVGAPGDESFSANVPGPNGAAYAIPIGMEPPTTPVVPPTVTLAVPGNVQASDGTAPDRIQVRWDDNSTGEDGHLIFRSNTDGGFDQLGQVAANVNFYDDTDASPGEAYTYCVAAFYQESTTDRSCDTGWRPANGTIGGRLAARGGGGTEDARVCLEPSPNKSLLFDGSGGFVKIPVGTDLNVSNELTIEAWIHPDAVDGIRYIVSKDSSYALALHDGYLRFVLFDANGDHTWDSPTAVTTGDWHHAAVTMSAAGDSVTFYLDGNQSGKFKTDVPLPNIIGDTLTIGQRGDTTGFYKGEIDEVRIWEAVRTDSLIQSTRFLPLKGDEENLIGYWPLDDGLRRVAPDLTKSANHGHLIDGVYLADEGAPLDICGVSTSDGNYSIKGIRYGNSEEFNVIPMRPNRTFEPSFKKITLSKDSPVQNEVGFTDVTAYPVSGLVQYVDADSLICPVPNVSIHVDKSNTVVDGNTKTTTGADGSYVVAVDPSLSDQDKWFIMPEYSDPGNSQVVHTFSPTYQALVVDTAKSGVNFEDTKRYTLSGYFSGGDPDVCGKDIGTALIRIYTPDGCYDRVDTVNSAVDHGAFSLDLPPLKYLVEVDSIYGEPSELKGQIDSFFQRLGAVEVDLTQGDVQRNLTFRAPLTLDVAWDNPSNQCSSGFTQKDEEGNIIRTIPSVQTIGELQFQQLNIGVQEDYGNGNTCPVNEGTVHIFDGISDRANVDSTMALKDGQVQYTVFGASPNVISGARIGGVDRSFQKPITVIAQVEGRDPLTQTKWALVQGYRERQATFVSATTGPFPLMILHDPPGGGSYAFLDKGSTVCDRISNTVLNAISGGLETQFFFGFKQRFVLAPLGVGTEIKTKGGVTVGFSIDGGAEYGDLWSGQPNREICVNTDQVLSTSTDPGWAGEDLFVGAALNLIFAIADVLHVDQSCDISLSQSLAADFNQSKPFATTYVYGASHIQYSLIPELENLLKVAGGDPSVTGQIDGQQKTIRLEDAIRDWKAQLANNDAIKAEALKKPDVNRSFSGGTSFSYTASTDTNTVDSLHSVRTYIDASINGGGTVVTPITDIEINVAVNYSHDWIKETELTHENSTTMGYVLDEENAGDYFSVDVAKDPRYGTFVFGTRSGRSSGPCEANTQCRDEPKILSVDPPVLFNVNPSTGGSFQVTLANASESNERREYILAAPAGTNPHDLTIHAGGSALGEQKYVIDPGRAMTVDVNVFPSPSAFAYKKVGLIFFADADRQYWEGDTRFPFDLADSAFFSVYFDSTGGNAMASPMNPGWTWFSINRDGGSVNEVLQSIPAQQGDLLRSQTAESRFDTTAGWSGELTNLVPGKGYRIKLKEPTVFRIIGQAVDKVDPITLNPGWNWVGYVPAERMAVDDALSSLNDKVQEGDLVVGQRKFAQYVPGTGWVGTLDAMAPGESYDVYLAKGGKLQYPTEVQNPIEPTVTATERTAQGPDWTIHPERFDAAMTMVAEVQLDGRPLDQTTTRVAVFAGDSLRGVGDVQYVKALDRYLAFVMIYGGSVKEAEPLMVNAYDGQGDKLYEQIGKLTYEPQSKLGEPGAPVELDLTDAGKAPELLDVPKTFALYQNYPNPFNPVTTIAYDIPKDAHVRIDVFDVLGRLVTKLVDSDQRAGRHRLNFDASQMASGFYVYRMKAGDFSKVHKMIVVK